MINYNGNIVDADTKLSIQNRGFKYGDSLFETIKVNNGRVVFWEDHYFRLMASMRMLRMEIPLSFTLEFLQEEIVKTTATIPSHNLQRVRFSVFRIEGGLYTPNSNAVEYLIEANELSLTERSSYKVDLYKDFYNFSGMLSNVKTNNKMLHILAGVFAKENDLDNCILLNERKGVCEFTNGNIFIKKGNLIKTPSLTEGCLKGIVRKKVIEIITNNPDIEIEETSITPFEIQKADEVFLTNSIVGIQAVTNYRKKEFSVEFSEKIKQNLKVLEMTS